METSDRIGHLENDIKILKNEVQAVLLDLRDKYLEADNPFNVAPAPDITIRGPIDLQPARNGKAAGGQFQGGSGKVGDRRNAQEPDEAEDEKGETHSQTAHEEVTGAQMRQRVPGGNRAQVNHLGGRNINLLTVGGLVNWADESVRKLGHKRTETILDIAEMMGLLSPEIKHIMAKFVDVDREGDAGSLSVRAFLDSLVKITTLLGKDNQTEAALFTILSGEDGDG